MWVVRLVRVCNVAVSALLCCSSRLGNLGYLADPSNCFEHVQVRIGVLNGVATEPKVELTAVGVDPSPGLFLVESDPPVFTGRCLRER